MQAMNKDYIDVTQRNKSTKQKLRKELIEEEKKYNKLGIPFCYRCATLDYDDLYESTLKEARRKEGNIKEEDLKVPKLNLKKYSDKNRFKIISETEALDFIPGTNKKELIGYHINYVCNERGCGRSVFLTVEQYNKLKGIKE